MEPTPDGELHCLHSPCCTHFACIPLREYAFCATWYFLRWVSSKPVMPSDMLLELRKRLGKRPFRYLAARSPTGVYDILVRVNPTPFSPWATQLLPDSVESHFPGGDTNSQAWHLRCCRDALLHDVQVWRLAFRPTVDNVVFGDEGLLPELVAELREVKELDGEI